MTNYRAIKTKDNEFQILKDDDIAYTITLTREGNPKCNCTGFKYRGTCKHIDLIKDFLVEKPEPHRHPREALDKLLPVISKFFDFWTTRWRVVGSYRRGLPDFKDIDIIAQTRDVDSWELLIDELENSGIYTRKIRGDQIARGTIDFLGEVIDLDINRVEIESDWIPQLLYRTGSKDNNIRMRAVAKSKGYTLNEHGIYDNSTGALISKSFKSEKEFYEFLGMKYLEPSER